MTFTGLIWLLVWGTACYAMTKYCWKVVRGEYHAPARSTDATTIDQRSVAIPESTFDDYVHDGLRALQIMLIQSARPPGT